MTLLPLQWLRWSLPFCFFFIAGSSLFASKTPSITKDTIIPRRFIPSITAVGIGYSAFSYGLYRTWYAPYRTTSFHLYNDWSEWRNMDKAGHLYTAYFQSALLYDGGRWTGLDKKSSLLYASGLSLLFLSTIEVMDGFSDGWGFSFPDMAANLGGVALFAGQEYFLGHQWVTMKWSSNPAVPSEYIIHGNRGSTVSLSDRSKMLFGSHTLEQLLKNYNATHIWFSLSPANISQTYNQWPDWLNIALGIGAGNLYGGFENKWESDGEIFEVPQQFFPRYTSIYLSPDINWKAIPVHNIWMKRLFIVLNIFKFPAPTLEYQSTGSFKWHWVLF